MSSPVLYVVPSDPVFCDTAVRSRTSSRGQAKEALFYFMDVGSNALFKVNRSLEMNPVVSRIPLDGSVDCQKMPLFISNHETSQYKV